MKPDAPAGEPPPITHERQPGSRRPHTDMTVAKVRDLIEHTALTYAQIQAQTGVDSSTIVALMARHSTAPIDTFAVGFDQEGFSELGEAELAVLAAVDEELEALGEEVRRRVLETSGIALEWEIKRIGIGLRT